MFKTGDKRKKYKIESIYKSAVYAKEPKGQLSILYYLILSKNNLKKKLSKSQL